MTGGRSRTQNEQTSTTQVTNLNVQDTEGVTIANSSGVTITQTDFGALAAAQDIGTEALRLGADNLETAANLAGRSLDTAEFAVRGAFDFGETAIGSQETIARDAISEIAEFGERALEMITGGFGDALGAQSRLTEQNLGGLTALARETSESADDRVSRTALFAFAAIAAIFVLPALFGKRAAA